MRAIAVVLRTNVITKSVEKMDLENTAHEVNY